MDPMDILYNNSVNFIFGILFLSMLCYWSNLAFPGFLIINNCARLSLLAANLFLSITIIIRWIESNHFPLSNLYESLLFLTWGITITGLYLERKTKSNVIGAIITPFSTFIVAFTTFSLPSTMQQATSLVPALQSNWLVMHVSVMMISYAILMVGTLLSILFLILSNEPQSKKSNAEKLFSSNSMSQLSASYSKHRLQLLESIDYLSYRTIALAFPLLTVGIISGAVWANEAWGSYWSWDPKETWALITWLVFASYLHTRIIKGWQGKKAAVLAAFGFIVVWICYLGVNFLGQGLHSYGWIQ
uniref:Cytochrome c biogenesis protein CcsA n=1 Tax=Bangiopsis subsimplex TaxID=139980 RepID=A0A1C9CCT2_9RHOD|nr:cytochrome c biogenesis protein [Bangiopsis subsimplex]AOM66167.1 cytochrome c biogenesis protein [Bangiopsis subsimplex]ARO90473.1 cytochrome c biogenesis protein [Bangiopsis subsimplex]